MKLRFVHILLMITCALSGWADNLGFSKERPLVFGMDQDYAPLEYLDESGQPSGYDVRFTQKLLKRLDIPLTYAPNTWENVAVDVLGGQADLAMMVYSPYRKDITHYSRAVFRLYYQMIFRKGAKRDYGLRNVKGKSIAFMESRPIIDTLTNAGARIHIVKDLKRATTDLAAGKYDAVICFRYQARFLLEDNHFKNLTTEDLTLMSREYCYVSNNKALIEAINQELDKMEEEGVIDEVYGNVRTAFDGLRIPVWVWFLVAGLIIISLLVFGIQQRLAKKRLQEEMERARENEQRAIKSEELKGIFLSNISHALRTPLNAIIGFSDLMLTAPEGEMPQEEQQQLLGLINNNGLQLLHLINELMSLSDIEEKQTLFDRKVTDVEQEMSAYASETRLQLNDGVTMEVEEPIGGVRALLDPGLLRVVTMHLLDNARQHTTEGKVVLTYYVKEGGIYVEVRDTGKGLPEKLRDNIFALLSDENTYVQDETPGLGLSICKAIVDRTGGRIGVRDNEVEGHGTVFWFWSPVEILN